MSLHLNNAKQMAMYDSLYNLTGREIKYLKNSWAETFSKKIFPFIKEYKFRVLYSDNKASWPNNPVNVYFGLLILREIFNQSDEEALNSLIFDIRYQYVLQFVPRENIFSMFIHGAKVIRVKADDYSKMKKHILGFAKKLKLRIVSGNGPIQIEGYKLTAFEMFEQMKKRVSDYIVVPISACGHIRGIFKGY